MFIYSDHHPEIAFSLFLNNVEIEGGKLSYSKKGAEYSCQKSGLEIRVFLVLLIVTIPTIIYCMPGFLGRLACQSCCVLFAN